jgi:hypothetical protein
MKVSVAPEMVLFGTKSISKSIYDAQTLCLATTANKTLFRRLFRVVCHQQCP